MKVSSLEYVALSIIAVVNAVPADISKFSIPSPTVSFSFPFDVGHDGDDMKMTTITRNRQQQPIKIFNDLYTRFTNFSKPKKVAVMYDTTGLHVQLQCLLKGKQVVSKPSQVPTPTPTPAPTLAPVPQTTTQQTTQAWGLPVETYTAPKNDDLKVAKIETSNDSNEIGAVITRVEYIETVLKSSYLLDLNEDDKNKMSDFLNTRFKLPTGFIQGILNNDFDHIDWDMAEKYVPYL